MKKYTAEIICVGTELLLGDIVDTNSVYASRALACAGIQLYHKQTVGDNHDRLAECLARAMSRSDIVILIGGLGPTYDDITKQTTAELLGKKLVYHKKSLERIETYACRRKTAATDELKRQALVIEGAFVFDNDYGSAPGMCAEQDGKAVLLLPGPPREFCPMFDEKVVPYLTAKYSAGTLLSVNLRLFGIGESGAEAVLRDMMESSSNPTLAPYAKDGEVLLRITAYGDDSDHCRALIQPMRDRVEQLLGEYIYGVDIDSLQEALFEKLKEKKRKISFAESCTGGLVAKRLTDLPGASSVFDGSVCVYSNEMKTKLLGVRAETLEQYGAVSEQTALEMARGVAQLTGADIGVSVTGIAGPSGGSDEKPVGLVYVAAVYQGKETVRELRLGYVSGGREYIRYLASSHALSLALQALR